MTNDKNECTTDSHNAVLDDLTTAASPKWQAIINNILLQAGLLDYRPQHLAFMHLLTKFIQDETHKAGRQQSQLRTEDLAALTVGFMEEYE